MKIRTKSRPAINDAVTAKSHATRNGHRLGGVISVVLIGLVHTGRSEAPNRLSKNGRFCGDRVERVVGGALT